MRLYILLLPVCFLLTSCSGGSDPLPPDTSDIKWLVTIGSVGPDTVHGLAFSESGDIIATGWYSGTVDLDPGPGEKVVQSNGSEDIFLMKFTTSGELVWATAWGGPETDCGSQVTVGTDGSIYVTGWCGDAIDFDPGYGIDRHDFQGGNDVFVAKFDDGGNYQWSRQWGGPDFDTGHGIALSPDGYIYCGWEFFGSVDVDPGPEVDDRQSNGGLEAGLSKFDTDGNLVDAWTFGGTYGDGSDGLVFDSTGNLYITGDFAETADLDPGQGVEEFTSHGERDVFLIKLDSSDNYVWARTWGGAGTAWDKGNGIALDHEGNVITGGFFGGSVDFDYGPGVDIHDSNGEDDAFVCKHDPSGNLLWANTWGGPQWDVVIDTFCDGFGNVYATGFYRDSIDIDPGSHQKITTSSGAGDFYISAFNSSGEMFYSMAAGGLGWDKGWDVIADDSGNIYVAGGFEKTVVFDQVYGSHIRSSVGDADIFIVCLSP